MTPEVTSFGDYVLLDEIATTALSRVYLAREKRAPVSLKSVVVLKRMSVELSLDHMMSREFEVEMALAKRMHHPKIIPFLHSGTHLNRHFLVMKYIRGAHLSAFRQAVGLRNEHIPASVVCHIICELLEALDYAHGLRGPDHVPLQVVHRDISPQNAMVDFDGKVYLADFGIAKLEGRPIKTATGIVKGKPGYLSPEQILMKPADNRSDLFSMGIVLWELLTSRRLFQSEDDADTLRIILEAEIPPPSSLNPDVPPELGNVVLRALARDPIKRYQLAREFLTDLRQFAPHAEAPQYRAFIQDVLRRTFGQQLTERENTLRQRLAQPPAEEDSSEMAAAMATQFTLAAKEKSPNTAEELRKVDVRSEQVRPERRRSRRILETELAIQQRQMAEAMEGVRRSEDIKGLGRRVTLYLVLVAAICGAMMFWFKNKDTDRGQKILGELAYAKKMLVDGGAAEVIKRKKEAAEGLGQEEPLPQNPSAPPPQTPPQPPPPPANP